MVLAMIRPFAFIALALALTLVLTGQALAVARGGGPAGAMDICTGRGMVTVALGADGQPMETVQLCPDCICHAVAAVLPPEESWQRPVSAGRSDRHAGPVTGTGWLAPDPQARDPPRAA